jgi:hypothetical protein
MVQMIFRKIDRIHQLKRVHDAVNFRYGYRTIQCNNRIRRNGHELIVELQDLLPIGVGS